MPPTQEQLQSIVDIDLEIASKSAIRDAQTAEINSLYNDRSTLYSSIAPSMEPGKIYIITSSVDSKKYAIYNNNNAPTSYFAEDII